MIVFKNKGAIDIRAITTFGVSSKENPDSAIGYFGTGLKYAIAICLRNGCDFSIVTGNERYDFAVQTMKIRFHDFGIITMNGDPLGFTTGLGIDWEMWQAYRELYCNVIDEGGDVFKWNEDDPYLSDDDENTYVLVTGDAIDEVYASHGDYFMTEKPFISDDFTEAIEDGDKKTLYFRGIRVYQSYRPMLFNYNFLDRRSCELTEDRTLKYSFQVDYNVQALIQQSTDEQFLRTVLTALPNTFEGSLDYNSRCRADTKIGATFMKVLGELRRELKDHGINVSALLLHKRKVEHSILPTESCQLNEIERKQLKKADYFCREVLELDLRKFPLIVCDDLGGTDLGRADMHTNIMYISRECFRQGTKAVAAALLEEFTHLDARVFDETVEQKWIYLRLIMSLGERLQGEPL
jgi:hypothetical protein